METENAKCLDYTGSYIYIHINQPRSSMTKDQLYYRDKAI